MLREQYQYQLFADYFQFYLEDENAERETKPFWAKDSNAVGIGLDYSNGIIAVGTERNYTVPVLVEIHDSEPKDDFSIWDRVNECSINIPSGILVIFGCTDYRPDAARVKISPQCYRARIYYGGLDTVKEFDEGDDIYKIALWAAPFSEMKILKDRIKKA